MRKQSNEFPIGSEWITALFAHFALHNHNSLLLFFSDSMQMQLPRFVLVNRTGGAGGLSSSLDILHTGKLDDARHLNQAHKNRFVTPILGMNTNCLFWKIGWKSSIFKISSGNERFMVKRSQHHLIHTFMHIHRCGSNLSKSYSDYLLDICFVHKRNTHIDLFYIRCFF